MPHGAIAEYKKEIELFPGSYMAQFNLGKDLREAGNAAEQRAAFRAAIESNPDFAEGHLFLAKLMFDLGEPRGSDRAGAARHRARARSRVRAARAFRPR